MSRYCIQSIIVLLGACAICLQAAELPGLISGARPALVFISTPVQRPDGTVATHEGTGFVISSDGYVLTASHVIPEPSEGLVGRTMGAKQSSAAQAEELEIIRRDKFFDAALLRFRNTSVKYDYLKVASHAAATPGTRILELGFPRGLEFNSKSGYVSGMGGPYGSLVSDLGMNPGDSGAPILNMSGEAIAIVVSDLSNAQGISFLLPITHVTSLLEIASVTPKLIANEVQDISYHVVGEISGTFDSADEWSNTFKYSRSDENCEANYDVTQQYCAPPGYQIKNPGQVITLSANCSSSVGSPRIASSACVTVPAQLQGCGYDRLFGQIVNCKGRGWIDYAFSLSATKATASQIEPYSFDLKSLGGNPSTFTATHPKAGANLAGRQWRYRVRVQVLKGTEVIKTLGADSDSPWPEGLATRISDGTLQISVLR